MKMTYNDDKNGGYVAKLKYVDINPTPVGGGAFSAPPTENWQ